MVFRRENKVDAFQRQMSQLRNQIGTETEEGGLDYDQDLQDLQDDRGYRDTRYADEPVSQNPFERADAGGYSFGSYPSPAQEHDEYGDEQDEPSVPELPGVDAQISVVAQGTIFKGDIQSDGSIQIYGRAEGTLTAKEDVWLAEGSDVEATVTARRVIVAGRVSGNVRAQGRFEALPQGVIEADVTAPSFVVHDGAAINGKLTMANNENTVSSGRAERAGSTPLAPRRPRL